MELDKETQEQLSQDHHLKNLVSNDDWKAAKEILLKSIDNLDRMSAIPFMGMKPEELMSELKARVSAKEIILMWLAVIEGGATQYDNMITDKEKNEEFIRRTREEN